jgi:hypothetical protein
MTTVGGKALTKMQARVIQKLAQISVKYEAFFKPNSDGRVRHCFSLVSYDFLCPQMFLFNMLTIFVLCRNLYKRLGLTSTMSPVIARLHMVPR